MSRDPVGVVLLAGAVVGVVVFLGAAAEFGWWLVKRMWLTRGRTITDRRS